MQDSPRTDPSRRSWPSSCRCPTPSADSTAWGYDLVGFTVGQNVTVSDNPVDGCTDLDILDRARIGLARRVYDWLAERSMWWLELYDEDTMELVASRPARPGA